MTPRAHPWMASSAPGALEAMLAEIGAASVDDLFAQIPAGHMRSRLLDLPPTLSSEMELKRELTARLRRNASAETHLCFLGAGVWPHHVPAIVDEVVGRTEFLTNVWGSYQSDHGRNQAWWEFSSGLGALLDLDVVQLPVYSWGCAIGHAARMAQRLTGRSRILVPRLSDPERMAVLTTYCGDEGLPGSLRIEMVEADAATGRLDLADLAAKLGPDVAAVYFENPAYLGTIETEAREIARLARAAGAETIVGVDPLSLGVLAAPGTYGADIVTGPVQPLGVHMNCGGGAGGFIASRDEERYVREYNGFLVSIAPTARAGERGFGLASSHQNSYGSREEGKDWTGNSVYLWAIANAVYMSLLGPEGFREVGEAILQRSHYAAGRLGAVPGVEVVHPAGFFKEFVVRTPRPHAEVEAGLRERGIFWGKHLGPEGMENCALLCVTEVHAAADIRRLASCLREVLA